MKLSTSDTSAAVDALMADLEHPHKDAIEQLRVLLRAADPAILEGVKWKAPSFHKGEYFGTVHLRAKPGIALILHLGAKVRDTPGFTIDDPDGLLKWLGKDRAMIEFADGAALKVKAQALQRLVQLWIQHL